MAREMSNSGSTIVKMGILLIVMIIIVFYVPRVFQTTPTVEVKECSLASDTIGINQQTTLTFTLQSNDVENAHSVMVKFSSHEMVVFMLGSQSLPKQDGYWIYTETLNPSASSTQPINVRANLENGIAKLDYRIDVTFYVDGEQFGSKALDLTVKR
jgi:competence protein ComGC